MRPTNWTARPGQEPTYRMPGDPNDGCRVGVKYLGFPGCQLLGSDADMVWEPEDQYATCPPNMLSVDGDGRYFVEPPDYMVRTVWMIDTRIPLPVRVFMSQGYTPVLSYREWREKAAAEAYGEEEQ